MRTWLAALAAMLISSTATAQSVEVGTARWDSFPTLRSKPSRLDDETLMTTVETILRTKQCQFKDQSARRFDISVPYAVQFYGTGKVTRVLVGRMDCNPLEQLVGYAVLAQADAGDLLPELDGKARWYSASMNFNLQ